MKLDLTKIDFHNFKIIQWLGLAFVLTVLVIDLFLFISVGQEIQQAKAHRAKETAALVFFKGLTAQKGKFAQARVLPVGDIDDLLDKVQKLAGKNHLTAKIDVYLATGKDEDTTLPFIPRDFSMDASGSFKDLGVFLAALRAMPETVIDVSGLHLSRDPITPARVHAQINLIILTTGHDEDQ